MSEKHKRWHEEHSFPRWALVNQNESAADQANNLVVVFAPGLWPFRCDLDRISWTLAQGLADALSTLSGLLGYATPRALVPTDSATSSSKIRVFRSLPPDALVADEARQLGAAWAVTGRILVDQKGLEFWLNLLDGPSGALLWTRCVSTGRSRALWAFLSLVQDLVGALGIEDPSCLSVRSISPTGSWQSLVSFAETVDLWENQQQSLNVQLDALRKARRAVALDPGFEEASQLFEEVGEQILKKDLNSEELHAIIEVLAGQQSPEPTKKLRKIAQQRLVALANQERQT